MYIENQKEGCTTGQVKCSYKCFKDSDSQVQGILRATEGQNWPQPC